LLLRLAELIVSLCEATKAKNRHSISEGANLASLISEGEVFCVRFLVLPSFSEGKKRSSSVKKRSRWMAASRPRRTDGRTGGAQASLVQLHELSPVTIDNAFFFATICGPSSCLSLQRQRLRLPTQDSLENRVNNTKLPHCRRSCLETIIFVHGDT
jgi:hypothetical protein